MQIDFSAYQKILQPDFLFDVFDKTSSRRYICQITQQKSGSWWVHSFLAHYFQPDVLFHRPGYFYDSLMPAWGQRGQEIDPTRFFLQGGLDAYTFFSPAHIDYSEYTKDLIEKSGMKVVLQVRNLTDSLWSLARFNLAIAQDKVPFMGGKQVKSYVGWRDEDIIARVVTTGAIASGTFLYGWLNNPLAQSPNVMVLDFDALRRDKRAVFQQIADFAELPVDDNQIERIIAIQDDSDHLTNKTPETEGFSKQDFVAEHQAEIARIQSYYPVPEDFKHLHDIRTS